MLTAMLNFELFAATHAMKNCSIVNFSHRSLLRLWRGRHNLLQLVLQLHIV